MDQAAAETQRERNDGSVIILISLYLLLLAFFIMLTALSEREITRAEAAVGSVTKAFRPDIAADTLDKTTDGAAGLFRARDAFATSLQALFADTLPVARFETLDEGNLLSAELPVERLFRPDGIELFGSGRELLAGMAAALNRREPEQRWRLEAVLRTGPVLPDGDRLGQVLELRRAAALARMLRAEGAAGALITVGLAPGDPGLVRFRFFFEPAAEPGNG